MRCPVCRAADNRTEQCRRCKADLSLLASLERDRCALLASAQWLAGNGEADAALVQARLAHQLRADSESFKTIALGQLLARDFAGALASYRQSTSA